MSVERFALINHPNLADPQAQSDPHGEWVRYSDHERALREVEAERDNWEAVHESMLASPADCPGAATDGGEVSS